MVVNVSQNNDYLVIFVFELKRKAVLLIYPRFPDALRTLDFLDP